MPTLLLQFFVVFFKPCNGLPYQGYKEKYEEDD
jgi:hypothetical protein